MKSFLLLTLVLLFTSAQAQAPITITSANMPSSGDTIRYSTANPQGINTSLTGANVFWNFDTLQYLNQDIYKYKSSLQTPYAFYFLGLNQYGLKIADTLGFGTFQFLDFYSFFNKTSSAFSAEGTGFKYQGIPLASQYSDDDEIFTFPLNFGDHDSTTFSVTTALGGTISYIQKGYRINDVDGWGIIKTPFDSVKCIRVVSTAYGSDSINFNGFGFSFPNVQRSYKWLSLTEKIPVLEISGQFFNGSFTANQVRYRDNYQALVSSINYTRENEKIKFFPNPAKDEIYLVNENMAGFYLELYNIIGELTFKIKLSDNLNRIDISNLESGLYQSKLINQSGKLISTGKIVIE
ncbi:MAG: T9SS type A sorting domain-containing protein [Bacteroidota bacterium]